ncbi:component of SufBCD complex [Pseudoroseicyclus tamaricis]|uniref:Component of SufBCD complex n=1 Tax=Pseudoroseicyclus tamaricis TaxID=2705421 RepID=A0A6B2JT42_9RHOB|nr:component of SufBCD complex [Pseudoroseicyclus tamaricis]NDV01727.1 component of SufBCD complex [Pseudoroseicyclus tamaricis]
MTFTDLLFQTIDFHSFSNLWYWIVLAVVWSSASHFVMGVPWDLVMRARREGGQAEADLIQLVGIQSRRMLFFSRNSGLWLFGLVCFLHSTLLVLSLWYGVEWAQAVELIALPMTLVGFLGVATAADFDAADELEADLIYRRLRRQRLQVQLIGMVSLVVTAMYGMYKTLAVGPFF